METALSCHTASSVPSLHLVPGWGSTVYVAMLSLPSADGLGIAQLCIIDPVRQDSPLVQWVAGVIWGQETLGSLQMATVGSNPTVLDVYGCCAEC